VALNVCVEPTGMVAVAGVIPEGCGGGALKFAVTLRGLLMVTYRGLAPYVTVLTRKVPNTYPRLGEAAMESCEPLS